MLRQRRGRPLAGGPPEAAGTEPVPDPLQRPAQLLPASGTRLEGRQLPDRGIGQAVEPQMDRCDPRLLLGIRLQASAGRGLDAREEQPRDPVRLEGRLRERLAHVEIGRFLEAQVQDRAAGSQVALAKVVAQVGGDATQGESRGADPVERRLEDDARLDSLGTP